MSEPPPWMPTYRLQGVHLQFASEAEAWSARILDWDELNTVLRHTCQAPPTWGGTICGNHQACTPCKLNVDDLMINPLSSRSAVLRALPTGLRHFDRAARIHSVLRPTLLETAQAVLTTPESMILPRPIAEHIKNWGYIVLHRREAQELLDVYRVPLDRLNYRTLMVNISGKLALRYQILFDPGKRRIRWLPFSACALGCLSRGTQPSRAKTVSDLVELLMGVYCLSFFFPATMVYGQAFVAALGADLTKTILASVRTAPAVPLLQWYLPPMEAGEAGLIYSPRRAPVLTPPSSIVPPGVGALLLTGPSPPEYAMPVVARSVS